MRKHPLFTWHGFQVTIHDLLLVGCFVALLGAIGYLVTSRQDQINQNHQLALQGQQAKLALCALRDDKRRQVRQSVAFLENHPQGAFGFTAKQILANIHDDQQTLKSLDVLVCK